MQTLKPLSIHIDGSFYDSQIYAGRLYLWNMDGSISIVDWDNLIENLSVEARLKVALVCAFRQSEYLYGDNRNSVFRDEEIKQVILNKFKSLARMQIHITKDHLQRFTLRTQNNPLPFPHSDCTIYLRTIYCGSSATGILATRLADSHKRPIAEKPDTLWDGPALGISASYAALAVASGSEGLFEYPLEDPRRRHSHREPRHLTEDHSSSARWLFGSIFSSSHVSGGRLADYTIPKRRRSSSRDTSEDRRILREVVPANQIFKTNTDPKLTYSWGVQDKICSAEEGRIIVTPYAFNREPDDRFGDRWTIDAPELHGDIVSADSAPFGFVVETEDGLLVFESSGGHAILLEGEPVNWRVFPRSKFYTNQLHVVHENRLTVHSFNHDYFVNQDTKIAGIRHRHEQKFFRAA